MADLRRATLRGANPSRAIIGWTVFGFTDLEDVDGFSSVTHEGPSFIGLESIESIYRSRGKFPKLLRGAGLPEKFIELIPSILVQPNQFYSCFISYSHADKIFARGLHEAKARRAG
jgi:hypothetical protein